MTDNGLDRLRPNGLHGVTRWLVVAVLVTSTTFTRPAQAARETAPPPALVERSKAPELADPAAQATIDAPPPEGWQPPPIQLAILLAEREPEAGQADLSTLPVRQFDIPAGPLTEALDAFGRAIDTKVEIGDPLAADLVSPGVSGLLTPEQALRALLAGTGATHRFAADGSVVIELAGLSEAIAVTTDGWSESPKFTQALRDTPQTITIVPRAVIDAQGATSLREVLRNVTGISIQAGEGGGGLPGDNLSIRGFAARNDIFVDGVRDFGAYTRDTFNVEQVEVIKGPASAIGGRGSTGGSVNLRTKTPQLASLRDLTLVAGTNEQVRATLDVNQPLGEFASGAALRVNAMWDEGDVAGRDVVTDHRWGVAPSLSFGLGDATRATLAYSRLEGDNVPDYGIPWVPPTNVPLAPYADAAPPVDFDNFYGLEARDYEQTTTDLATITVDSELAPDVDLRALVRHGTSDRDSIITAPRFVSDQSTLINRQLQSRDLEDEILAGQVDVVARFSTGSIGHSLVAGVEVAEETAINRLRSGPLALPTDLFDPNPAVPYPGPIVPTGARTESEADTAAVYAFDTMSFGEHFEAVGGLRFDRFSTGYTSIAVDGTRTELERTDEEPSWRLGLVGKPRGNGSIYAGYGTSFNPASEGNTGLSLTPTTADLAPEESRSMEVGTKWDHPTAGFSWNAAVFRTDKINARTPGLVDGEPTTVLQGKQRVEGVELGVAGTLAPNWTAFGGYTWMRSEILESNIPAEVGKEMPNTPEHSLSFWTTYRFFSRFEVGGGVQYVDDRFNNNINQRTAPSYWLAEATAAADLNERFTLRLNVGNLADERYIDRVGGGHFIPGAGRTASITAVARF